MRLKVFKTASTKGSDGIATLEAALFLSLVFVPAVIFILEIWSTFTVSDVVEEEISRIRATLSTVNLQIHTARYGTFPRHRIPSDKDDIFSPTASYEKAALRIIERIKALRGVDLVEVEMGFFAPRIFESTGSVLAPEYGSFEVYTGIKMPKTCSSWKQPIGGSLLLLCTGTTPQKNYRDSLIWRIFGHHSDLSTPANSRAPYRGRVWASHSLRRLQRTLGSSIWCGKRERDEAAARTTDGNDYQWSDHPRFGVISGYAIRVTLDRTIIRSLGGEDTLEYYGIIPLAQEL
jgi:hypothetical protein